jgi:RNA recognition motif-containing protein
MTDRETGRSRGFAFVEMENEGEADQAISALNGYTLDGRALNVNEARPKPDRGFGGGGGGRPSGGGGRRPGGGGGGGGSSRREPRW